MNEDFANKAWADHHATLSTGIARAIRTFGQSLAVLNAKQFDAPWRHAVPTPDCRTR